MFAGCLSAAGLPFGGAFAATSQHAHHSFATPCRCGIAFERQPPHPASMVGAHIVLYSTSCAPTAKGKADINRIKNLLDAKRVRYEEVSRGSAITNFLIGCWFLRAYQQSSLPLLHRDAHCWRLQRPCSVTSGSPRLPPLLLPTARLPSTAPGHAPTSPLTAVPMPRRSISPWNRSAARPCWPAATA